MIKVPNITAVSDLESAGKRIYNRIHLILEDDVDLCLLASALDTLSPREREIITLRFGLGGGKEQTQKEVADAIGISQSYISRLEKRIIRQLKEVLERE